MSEKIKFVYQIDEDSPFEIESLWADKIGEYYQIDNIPFFAKNIAVGDIVSIEEDGGELFFDALVQASGHSVVRVLFNDAHQIKSFGEQIIKLGCSWEGNHIKTLISIDIPKNVDYSIVRNFLEEGENRGKWEYQEACIAHN